MITVTLLAAIGEENLLATKMAKFFNQMVSNMRANYCHSNTFAAGADINNGIIAIERDKAEHQ